MHKTSEEVHVRGFLLSLRNSRICCTYLRLIEMILAIVSGVTYAVFKHCMHTLLSLCHLPNMPKSLSPVRVNSILALLDSKHTHSQIKSRLGVSSGMITKVCQASSRPSQLLRWASSQTKFHCNPPCHSPCYQ